MADQPSLDWSASLTVASLAAYSSKDLKGDKILLPQSALEQLLAASTNSTSTSRAASTSTSYDPYNPYAYGSGRPQHAFYADSQQQLPNPLMFQLLNKANGNTVHAGIREFSAQEGEVALSPYLLEALGIDVNAIPPAASGASEAGAVDLSRGDAQLSAPQITVRAKQLSKGTYVRLRPLEAGYNPDDWKSLLERQLRESFTTLTKGAFLSVRGVKAEEFRFLVDKFEPDDDDGICVVDTDLQVDIEALNEDQARETMRQIMEKARKAPGTEGGSSVGHEINIWKDVEGQVVPGDYVDYELPSWSHARPLEIELSGLQDAYGIDLLVSPKGARQRAQPRETEHVFGVFEFTSAGVKKITIQPTNVAMEDVESILITIHGYVPPYGSPAPPKNDAPLPFKLRARSVIDDANHHRAESQAPQQHSEDEEQCKNCHQWVPKNSMVLHENFCLRNNISCPDCGNVFQKSSQEWKEHWHCPHDSSYASSEHAKAKHNDIFHTNRHCPGCRFTTNAIPDLARHRTTLCPAKIILCQFCHLEVPQEGDPFNPSAETILSGLTEHEIEDGARTTDCHLCGRIIRLRDMSAHLKNHEMDKQRRPKPQICRNPNCGRTREGVGRNGAINSGTRMGQGPGNDLGLCSLCFTPLYVQFHDPAGKALRRRIERKYLTQLMQGCGRRWCENEWCKTGRVHRGLEAKPTTSTEILPLIKPLMRQIYDTTTPIYFCVDETNQKRRKLAERLAVDDLWDLEWCIAACEAEGPNEERARDWLGNWAPMKP